MANTVAGARKINAVLFGNRAYVTVVVGIHKSALQSVVVDIRHALFGLYSRNTDFFKLKISHSAGCILS